MWGVTMPGQGPCHKGDLMVVNPLTTEAYCSCDPDLLSQYFYPPLKLCYEHFTKVFSNLIILSNNSKIKFKYL